MPAYRRVLAIVDLGRSTRDVARTAFGIAQHNQARFAIGHVADWGLELGADDFCPYTPQELEEKLTRVVRRQLRALADGLGAREAAGLVTVAGPGRGVAELAGGWQPDLMVVGAGLEWVGGEESRFSSPDWSCDVLVVPTSAPGLFSQLARAIGHAMAPTRLGHR